MPCSSALGLCRITACVAIGVSYSLERLRPRCASRLFILAMNQSIGAYGEAQGKYGQSALSLAATAQVGAVILALQLCVMAVHRYIRNETVSMTRLFELIRASFHDHSCDSMEAAHLDFLRFNFFLFRLFAGLSLIVLPVLLPVNMVLGSGEAKAAGLDRLSYFNIPSAHAGRFWAHIIIAYVVVTLTCYGIKSELITHANLFSNVSSKTSYFLVAGPHNSVKLRAAGLLKKYIVPRNRTTILECEGAAYLDLQRVAALLNSIEECLLQPTPSYLRSFYSLAKSFVKKMTKQDPSIQLHRHFLALRQHTLETANMIAEKPLPELLLVEVDTTMERSIMQSIDMDSTVICPTDKYLNNVIWRGLLPRTPHQRIRDMSSRALGYACAILLAVPVSFTGILSQFLTFLQQVGIDVDVSSPRSSWLDAYLRGMLPQILSLLFTFLSPVLIRRLVSMRPWVTVENRDNSLQKHLFAYLFFQIFIFVSISASLTLMISLLVQNPTQALAILGRDLPRAANYFISLIVIQGLVFATIGMTDWKMLLDFYVLSRLQRLTLRRMLALGSYSQVVWTTMFPSATVVGVIGLIYAVTTPVILPCCVVSFLLLLWSFSQRKMTLSRFPHRSGPPFFSTALFQLFLGLYVMEMYLLTKVLTLMQDSGKSSAFLQALSMWILLSATALFHFRLWCDHKAWRWRVMGPITVRTVPRDLDYMLGLARNWFSQAHGASDCDTIQPRRPVIVDTVRVSIRQGPASSQVDVRGKIHVPVCNADNFATGQSFLKIVQAGLHLQSGTFLEGKIEAVTGGGILQKNGHIVISDTVEAAEQLQL